MTCIAERLHTSLSNLMLHTIKNSHWRHSLQYSEEHKHWTSHQWSHILLSDESRFSQSNDSQNQLLCRKVGIGFIPLTYGYYVKERTELSISTVDLLPEIVIVMKLSSHTCLSSEVPLFKTLFLSTTIHARTGLLAL
ncbi:hypothetical protein TNCV_3518771 [Trichonephila clavipes]|uniref:Uncharacterized protein n=1 Tax=Trichonephila clavipes TaxID=2585209 RepID=A0A8X6SPF3_TRICX|nr:hypothetical protein TNCV_3518771 [Trichonephila clavipes]